MFGSVPITLYDIFCKKVPHDKANARYLTGPKIAKQNRAMRTNNAIPCPQGHGTAPQEFRGATGTSNLSTRILCAVRTVPPRRVMTRKIKKERYCVPFLFLRCVDKKDAKVYFYI